MDTLTLVGVIVIAVLSITSHEAAHGFAADRLGDSTAREAGRLTLNPIPHIDPFFTILLPLALLLTGAPFIFGGAKPVPIDTGDDCIIRGAMARSSAPRVPGANIAIALGLMASFAISKGTGTPSDVGLACRCSHRHFHQRAACGVQPDSDSTTRRVARRSVLPARGALAVYLRIEQFGLLIIVALLLFVPRLQQPLLAAVPVGDFVRWRRCSACNRSSANAVELNGLRHSLPLQISFVLDAVHRERDAGNPRRTFRGKEHHGRGHFFCGAETTERNAVADSLVHRRHALLDLLPHAARKFDRARRNAIDADAFAARAPQPTSSSG